MPQHKSCIKRVRTAEKARANNRQNISRFKTAQKKVLNSENKEEGLKALKAFQTLADRLVRKNYIKRNYASNKLSNMTRRVSALAS